MQRRINWEKIYEKLRIPIGPIAWKDIQELVEEEEGIK